jgi:hypothetical protein
MIFLRSLARQAVRALYAADSDDEDDEYDEEEEPASPLARVPEADETSQEAGDAVMAGDVAKADAPPPASPGEGVRAETGAKPGSRGQELLSYVSASSGMPPAAPGDSNWK